MADHIHGSQHDSDKTIDHHSQESHHHHHHDQDYPQMNPGWARAEAGSLHPGLWKPYEHRKFANPAPLGLSAFALTTFVLSCINMHARGETAPNIVIPLAFAYGGIVQLCAGMWYARSGLGYWEL